MRHDTIIRCFQTIEAMDMKGGTTAKELAKHMGVSVRTAYRYIASASVAKSVVKHPGAPTRFERIKPEASFDGVDIEHCV
jgi:predicted DNA-binding transcriptional regulator YafY